MAYYNRGGDDPKHKGTFDKDAFKRGIAYTESRNFENPYEAIPVNKKGELLSSAAGKYQFLYNEIKGLPQMRGISKEEFLNNPELQEMIMDLAVEGKLPNRPGYYKNANDLTNSYAPLYGENWRYRPDEVAALTHYLGRKGARDYMRAQLEGEDYTVAGKTNMDVEDYLRTYNEGVRMGYAPETPVQSQHPYEGRVNLTSGASYQQDPRVMRDMQSIDRMNPNNYRQDIQLPNNMSRGEFPTYIPPSGGMTSIEEPVGNYSNDPRPQSQLTMPESQTTKPQAQLTGTEFIQQYIQTNRDKFADGGYLIPKRRNGVRQNPDGTVSTHRMAYGSTDNGYVAHPTLFQNPDGTWVEGDFQEAKRRGEVYNFKTEDEARNFAGGNWKKMYNTRNNPIDERYNAIRQRDNTYISPPTVHDNNLQPAQQQLSKQPMLSQDNRTKSQRKADYEKAQRINNASVGSSVGNMMKAPLLYLNNPMKIAGDLGVDNWLRGLGATKDLFPTTDEDYKRYARIQERTDISNAEKINMLQNEAYGLVPDATLNTAFSVLGANSLSNAALQSFDPIGVSGSNIKKANQQIPTPKSNFKGVKNLSNVRTSVHPESMRGLNANSIIPQRLNSKNTISYVDDVGKKLAEPEISINGREISHIYKNKQGEEIGSITFVDGKRGFEILGVRVNDKFRRQGYAEEMYKDLNTKASHTNKTVFSEGNFTYSASKDGKNIAPAKNLWEKLIGNNEASLTHEPTPMGIKKPIYRFKTTNKAKDKRHR